MTPLSNRVARLSVLRPAAARDAMRRHLANGQARYRRLADEARDGAARAGA
jgi:DNA-binding FadR family transcriptional regulator